ncbi:MAG: metallophosphoesterase [Prevotella sp.]|nr:metallophosphoesterase [Prevotella sp.]
MIARIIVLLLLLIAIPDLYFHWHYLSRRKNYSMWKRLLFWLPAVGMTAYALALTTVDGFAPTEINWLYLFLLLLGLIVIPKAVFALCSWLGLMVCRMRKSRRNWGNAIGLLLALLTIYFIAYGSTLGVMNLKVRHVELAFSDLPASFDGYRIVHFSDIHAGSLTGFREKLLDRTIDSINAQKADMAVFTGDLQNILPQELDGIQSRLSTISAHDGVLAVLGNHDYANYIEAEESTRHLNEQQTQSRIRSMGWQLLMNENRMVKRNNDSIFVAGTEDNCPSRYRKGPLNRSDIGRSTHGVGDQSFLIMLQHAPTLWADSILGKTHAQLTLSGHTHGGQVRLFGISPARAITKYVAGIYNEGERALYVSAGVSGLVPFRFGVPPEITVITLRKK